MRLLDWIARKLSPQTYKPYQFTSADRDLAVETRKEQNKTRILQEQLAQETAKLEAEARNEKLKTEIEEAKARREELLGIDDDDDDNDNGGSIEDKMMLKLLEKIVPSQNVVAPPVSISNPATTLDIPDEDISGYLRTLSKKQIMLTKTLNDEQLIGHIKTLVPRASDSSIIKILKGVRSLSA
jgi:hypothetical protein